MKRVGILGGGQLGLLLVNSIFKLGGRASIYDQDGSAPGMHHVSRSYHGSWTDFDALKEFFQSVDVVTYEFENVEATKLVELEATRPVYPSIDVLKITQDRAKEKQFLRSCNLPHVNYAVASSKEELRGVGGTVSFPCIIKTTRGGYDGKGQLAVADASQYDDAVESFWQPSTTSAVVEQKVDLAKEVSCIVARSPDGSEVVFPVLENTHEDHILDTTLIPATVPESVQSKVMEIALSTARCINLVGLLTVEFFLCRSASGYETGIECDGWQIFINELAPRPHNSGHVTMNACTISQYDALARILLDVPLTRPEMLGSDFYCMMNLLGDVWIDQGCQPDKPELDLQILREHPNVIDVVIYGKVEARRKRKMGHFVTRAGTSHDALRSAQRFKEALVNCKKSNALN